MCFRLVFEMRNLRLLESSGLAELRPRESLVPFSPSFVDGLVSLLNRRIDVVERRSNCIRWSDSLHLKVGDRDPAPIFRKSFGKFVMRQSSNLFAFAGQKLFCRIITDARCMTLRDTASIMRSTSPSSPLKLKDIVLRLRDSPQHVPFDDSGIKVSGENQLIVALFPRGF